MNLYYIRCNQDNYRRLLTLGQQLGVLTLTHTEFVQTVENGVTIETPVGDPIVSAAVGGAWDYIGEILDTAVLPALHALADANGNPYLHANLITPLDIEELAQQKPETQQAYAELGQFFLMDAQGKPRAPSQPFRVFL